MSDTDQSSPSANAVEPELLKILRCPVTHSELTQDGDWLVASRGGLAYPVRDGIPVMLPEEARLPDGADSVEQIKSRFGR